MNFYQIYDIATVNYLFTIKASIYFATRLIYSFSFDLINKNAIAINKLPNIKSKVALASLEYMIFNNRKNNK